MNYTQDDPLLMIPGPVESSPQTLKVASERTYAHTERKFVDSYKHALENLRIVFGTGDDHHPVAIAGGGTLAMEIAMINLIDRDKHQELVICETGYFGDRYATIADKFGLGHGKISTQDGTGYNQDALVQYLEHKDVDFAFIQHVDTSTGVANDIETFAKICQEYDVISVVDGVCALGGQELYQQDWGIDIYLTGAQKALAVPPGLAILMYSPQAREISENRDNPIPSYYANLENWWPIMDAYLNGSVSYFSTPATNLIVSLEQATTELIEEGMDNVYARHRELSRYFRVSMTDLGFDFITAEADRANTLSTPKYLEPTNGAKFRQKVLEQGVLIAGGIQQGLADAYFRVGHMGQVTKEQIDFTLQAIETSI